MQATVSDKAKHPQTTFRIQGEVYTARLFHSPDEPLFPEIGGTSIFLNKAYQQALAAAPPENMDFWYVRIEKDGECAGMLGFQISSFNPGRSLRNHMYDSFRNQVRYRLASLINLRVLCLGNTLLTGDYGFCFEASISSPTRTLLMMETIEWLLKKDEFKKIRMVFVKDFYENIFEILPDSPFCKKYHFIDTQPSMILDIRPSWGSLQGYMDTLKSKYRVRARKAIQLAARLEKVELSEAEIEANEETLHALYLKVVEDVGFNLFILSPDYFTALKKHLGDKFHLWVYKEEGEIISFFTVFEDRDILDAHFLGYDPAVNHHYKLYLNMLLAMIDFASTRGFSQLQLSRTATEIKSSVGAEGVPMWAYLRFTSAWLNGLVPALYSFFKPDMKWVPREPFH